jgi:AraC-like DNA-binding protein
MFKFETRNWARLAEESGYSARKLANLCHVSSRHLARQFNRYTGASPQQWLDDRRILLAKGLLLTGESVKTVAIELGYKHSSYFSRRFKQCEKVPPSHFLRKRLVLNSSQNPENQ